MKTKKSKQLLTLKEISEELSLNYSTLITCKRNFEDILLVKNKGRRSLYPRGYLDFFKLVFALKDEGYIIEDIAEIIEKCYTEDLSNDLAEWVDYWSFKLLNDRFYQGFESNEANEYNGTTEASESVTESKISEMRNELQQYVDLQFSEIKDFLVSELNSKIDKLQSSIESINNRLAYLESELGVSESQGGTEPAETDEAEFIVDGESKRLVDLEIVHKSVKSGVPDRHLLLLWLKREVKVNNSSQLAIADKLNKAGIPTLSGRSNWSRGTVGSLLRRVSF